MTYEAAASCKRSSQPPDISETSDWYILSIRSDAVAGHRSCCQRRVIASIDNRRNQWASESARARAIWKCQQDSGVSYNREAPDEITWFVALLYAPLRDTRRAAPCWPVESSALLSIAAAQADIMSCCNGCCTAAALNLHRCSLSPPPLGMAWLVHGQGHRPCPLHNPAGHRGWAKAHDVRVR